MHFVVANIPEVFRTPDLRNYFSLFIEKEAFNCFHFRHRPCKQFRELLLSISHSQNESETDIQSASSKVKEKENTPDEDKTMPVNESDTTDVNDRPNATHWLSSGLSGLSSLINEKKKKAQESKSGFEKMGIDKSLELGSGIHKEEITKETAGHSPAEISSILKVLQVLECAKGTCSVVNVKDSKAKGFMEFYNNKHFVDRDGNVHPLKCLIHRLDLNKNVLKGM